LAAWEDNTDWIATQNDKIVSYCENGVWITPSHECLCPDEIERRRKVVSLDCDLISAAEISISTPSIASRVDSGSVATRTGLQTLSMTCHFKVDILWFFHKF